MPRETAQQRFERLHPPTPAIQITIEGRDRCWVADALYQATREQEQSAVKFRKGSKTRFQTNATADRLRDYADRITP